ncbi:hypothetical protein C9994_00550 [Marivirga lumbricoides]|uniref:histidine kinase n=1 Tax=Marivirga lumbricoides TaxID=1046115 RepID=A0A2T4DVW2_9BACT|nr:hypothetical protein C9994_00550 [Marivirga lumbricoides]
MKLLTIIDLKIIALIISSVLHVLPSKAQGNKKVFSDSIAFQNFDGALYRASSYNYKVAEDKDGIIYIGNENGLLEFDGASWLLHQTNNFTPVSNFKIVGDKIYTVGNDEIGYFQRNSFGKMQYYSLRNRFDSEKEIRDVWYIEELDGKVYFNSYARTLVWDGEVLRAINLKDCHLFKVGGQLIFSAIDKGILVPYGDTVKYINSTFRFPNDAAYDIVKDSKSRWTIFTSESGIYRLDTTNFNTSLWKSEINDYFLRRDRALLAVRHFHDSLFLATSWENGIIIFNEQGEILKEFGTNSSLNTPYYNIPVVDRRGNIWLANALGMNYMKWIRNTEKLDFKPRTLLRYLTVEDSTFYVRRNDDFIDFSQSGEEVRSISFHFATPSFITQELEYSYYLEGFDKDWSPWNSETKKEYTNLNGGEFTFRVKARHLYLKDLEIEPFILTINTPTPWYLNKWNYLILSVLFVGLILVFIRFRTQKLSARNKKLELMVEQRTSELLTQQEQLKLTNDELKTINIELDNFVYRSSHDLIAPLKSLRGLIQIAQNENDAELRMRYFGLMNTSVNKLEDFIKSIMDFSTNSKKPIEYQSIKLDDLLDSIVHDIKYYDNSEKVKLIRMYDSDFEICTDVKRLHIILSNLVTNAVKYHNFHQDAEPYIKISAVKNTEYYEIHVEDNGLGIPEEFHSKIFDMFFRAHQGSQGSGLGLYIVIDTLNILNGKISFTSKLRKGTIFKIQLPLPA